MQKLVFINGAGNQIDLTAGNFGITNWAGLSNTGLNIQTQQVPFEDGGVFLDALMEQREIEVTVAIYDGNNLELRYQKKRELISALNPKLGEGTLIYTNNHLSRQIKAVPQIPLFENKNSNDAGTLKASVAFSCPSPYWEDLEETVVNIQKGALTKINNNGDVSTSIDLTIHTTNATDPYIKSLTEDKQIKINGNIQNNININTQSGIKTVKTQSMKIEVVTTGTDINQINFIESLNLYILVMNATFIMISKDGYNFESVIVADVGILLKSICYSDNLNLFVAVGTSGHLYTSSDLKTWSRQITSISRQLNNIIYKENLFVAVGDNGTIITSSDGINWTNKSTGTSQNLNKVIYSEYYEKFIVVGNFAKIIESPDGITWSEISEGSVNSNYTDIIEKDNMLLICGTSAFVRASTDGNNWQTIDVPLSNLNLYSIVYSKTQNKFVIGGQSGSVIYSEDGINWNRGGGLSRYIKSMLYSEQLGVYIAVGTMGVIGYSNVGYGFEVNYNAFQEILKDIIYSKYLGKYISVGYNGELCVSDDLLKWGISTLAHAVDIYSVCSSEKLNILVAVGENGAIYKSSDAVNWLLVQSGVNVILNKVVYSEKLEKFVAIGYSGTILTSDDGENWSQSNSGVSVNLLNIIYSEEKNLFVAVGYSGTILYSSNGIIWQQATSPVSNNLIALSYSNRDKMFYIFISNKTLRSYDGINWSEIANNITINIDDVTYSEEHFMFYAICAPSFSSVYRVYISVDGINWVRIEGGTNQVISRVKAISDKVLFVGADDLILKLLTFDGVSIIEKLNAISDMSFSLSVGTNEIILASASGVLSGNLKYRQKYIGV